MPKKLPSPKEMKKAVEEFKKQFTPGFYHGSPSNKIKAFDPAHNPSLDASYAKETNATFLSRDPSFANSFLPEGRLGESYRTGSTIYPVSANLGKHFDHETPEGMAAIKEYLAQQYPITPDLSKAELKARLSDRADEYSWLKRGAWDGVEGPAFQDFLRNNNYDSFATVEAGRKNVGIFEPHNIRGKFAEYNPEEAMNPDFMKAEGGAVEGYDIGGKVKAAAKFARHPHGQDPRVARALEEYLKGNISQEERIRIMNQFLPMRQWKELPPNYTDDEIRNALLSNKQAKALAPVPAGMRVGNRLDIPAYTQHGVYVDTTHDAAGKPISYGRTGHLKDVEFSSSPDTFVRVGLGTKEQALTPLGAEIGTSKTPKAMIKGIHQGTPDDEVRRMMQEMMQDPRYTQIGMDPRKHSQFYDKETGMPVWAAEEKLQSGPLILAPKQGLETTSWDDPRLNLSDFEGKKYAPGGAVKAAKKALEHARQVKFVHYSNKPDLTELDPRFYGTGIKGKEAGRLKNAPDIRPRSYFYTDRPDVRPEQGLGSHKYSGVAEDIYPLHEDPAGYSAIAKTKAIDPYMMQMGREVIDQPTHLNELERLIKGAGYKGYANDDVGLLFDPTQVQKVGGPEHFAIGGAVGAASPYGFVAPTGMATQALTPWYNQQTGETYTASSGGWSNPDSNWMQGTAPEAKTGAPAGTVWSETQGAWVAPGPNSGAMPSSDMSMPISGMTLPVSNPTNSNVSIVSPGMGQNPDGTWDYGTPMPIQNNTPAVGGSSSSGGLSGLIASNTPAAPTAPISTVSPGMGQQPDGSWNYGTPMPIQNNTPPIPQNSGTTQPPVMQSATNVPMPPNSPVAAATPTAKFKSLIRPQVFNKFGAAMNQVRQAGTATPQTRRGPAVAPLSRFRRR